ncbi:MAG: response regulator transcription factor [Acidobacteriaceae bacterium]
MQNALPAVLLIDDDTALADSLTRLLLMDGFLLEAVHEGAAGMRAAMSGRYALVLLDVMLPDADGRKLLRTIRTRSDVPIIMLTARGDDADRIQGLEGGADDFLPKPFNPRELIARMRAVLKRQTAVAAPAGILEAGDLTLRPSTREVAVGGEAVVLTGAEFDLLACLVRMAGTVVSRDTLVETALGRPLGMFDRSVDNHMSNLRRKLGVSATGEERIRNVRGAGYAYLGELRTTAEGAPAEKKTV